MTKSPDISPGPMEVPKKTGRGCCAVGLVLLTGLAVLTGKTTVDLIQQKHSSTILGGVELYISWYNDYYSPPDWGAWTIGLDNEDAVCQKGQSEYDLWYVMRQQGGDNDGKVNGKYVKVQCKPIKTSTPVPTASPFSK